MRDARPPKTTWLRTTRQTYDSLRFVESGLHLSAELYVNNYGGYRAGEVINDTRFDYETLECAYCMGPASSLRVPAEPGPSKLSRSQWHPWSRRLVGGQNVRECFRQESLAAAEPGTAPTNLQEPSRAVGIWPWPMHELSVLARMRADHTTLGNQRRPPYMANLRRQQQLCLDAGTCAP